MVEWNKQLGERLRERRKLMGFSLRSLGKKAGIPFPTVAALERGEQCPSVRYAKQLSEALGCSTDWLCSEDCDAFSIPRNTSDLLNQLGQVVFVVRQKWSPRQLSHLAQGLFVVAESLLQTVDLPLPEPTQHARGSEEKILELQDRFAKGEGLWNDSDNPHMCNPRDDWTPDDEDDDD
jgi:transcriptional regulator with XRE-family HTH domain